MRYRNKTYLYSKGGIQAEPRPGYEYLGPISRPSVFIGREECFDEVGLFEEDNLLEINKYRMLAGTYSGNNGTYYRDQGWELVIPVFSPLAAGTPSPSLNAMMSDAVNRSAPYTPSVDVVGSLLQLKDFKSVPKDLKRAGDSIRSGKPGEIARSAASGHLAWQFGIAPLISDIQKVLNFQKTVESRMNMLRNMSSPKGASKSVTTYRDQSPDSYQGRGYFADHYGAVAQYDLYFRSTRKSWGSTRWVIPPNNLPRYGSPEYASLARRLAFSTMPFSTMWELLPWTWIIDWFTNIGDFIGSTNNVIGAHATRMCIMEYTKTIAVVYPIGDARGFHPLEASLETKKRTPISFTYPEVHLPIITGGQMATLTSLFTQRHPF